MKYTVPDYYRSFKCIAGDCPATCCAGWQIVIDEKSQKKYKQLNTPFGNRLNNSIDWQEHVFLQYDKRCAFLNDENLCDIYIEAGSDYLCRTCRRYPRHVEEFENEREVSLSLSCPVVARMLINRKSVVKFISAEDQKEENEEGFDFFLYSALQDCRKVMLEMLQNRKYPISFRMGWVLALAHDVQNRIDHQKIFEIEELLHRYTKPGASGKMIARLKPYRENPSKDSYILPLFELFDEWEVLDPSWVTTTASAKKRLFRAGIDQYKNLFEVWRNHRSGNEEIEAEQLMVYFIYTYFCGAVYDGEAFAKVKMAIISTLLIQTLEMSEWLEISEYEGDGEGKIIDRSDEMERYAWAAWSFSREMEHSDLNLEKTEKWSTQAKAAEFETLLRAVLDQMK